MKLFCRSYGSGPPLIILHGLYGSSDNWMSIAKMVGDHYTVYLPDLRNHGKSPHSDIMDYQAMSNDILELADQLNLNNFFLAGHSMGGKAAMAFAVNWPERISGLLIADISPFVNEPDGKAAFLQHKTILEAMYNLNLTKISTRTDADAELKGKINSEKIRGFILKNLQRSTGNRFVWKLNVPSLLNNLKSIMEGIELKNIPDEQVTGFPVIFLKGSESDYINIEDYPYILKIFPAAEIIEIREAGHWLHADQPEEVAKNLLRLSGND
ncbi:MAG TPA: alpha/beta fold hydrolase [Bacteroidales bacterium]|nr:alpha/beta fold hydrolase [Bacteroidales bacterium]